VSLAVSRQPSAGERRAVGGERTAVSYHDLAVTALSPFKDPRSVVEDASITRTS